ncbi:TPA: ABC transporter ATP-binding protein, partial [Streptococcus pyogenes]|nr:ABC transporter ATP-binding protein [Streptococcus pyogenes]
MAFIELKQVSKSYQVGETTVFANHEVSFEINKGELVVILGASGAGKSTVLNILGGMDTVDAGQVIIDGKDIAHYTSKALTQYRRNAIGFVFQFYNLVPNLTAKENVELAVEIVADALDPVTILKEVGLSHRLDH